MAEDKKINIEEAAETAESAIASEAAAEAAAETASESEDLKEITEAVDEAGQEEVAPASPNIKQGGDNEPHWYVIHTYSGYENKVKMDIEKTIENRRLQEQMFDVLVPMREETVYKGDTKKKVLRKMYPGYVIVHMILNDVTWYVVRNTSGVTGFVGPGSEPVPLTDSELRMFGVKKEEYVVDVAVGDSIKVISGAWEGTVGMIKLVNVTRGTVTIEIDVFGRSTDVEIGMSDIKKL